jgi:ADP-heptose:LPS heptosyltransferase
MLQISNARERALVRTADAVLRVAAAAGRFRRRQRPDAPQRILLLRLERIGDLLMALPAIRDVRALAPTAEIDLVVGTWNASLGRAVPFVNNVLMLDAQWLAREGGGRGMAALLGAARGWRTSHYDLAINFEPDIRSNLLLAASGAKWRAGWASAGGGPLLDLLLDFDPAAHTIDNARRLVHTVFEQTPTESALPLLAIPESARRGAQARLRARAQDSAALVGVHVSGGREIKQWDPLRFAEVAAALVRERHATIVLTGTSNERALIDVVKSRLPEHSVIDISGDVDLLELAALLQQLDLLVTGDTGPMHLAAAVGTPVVAVFGPSAPHRYAPRGDRDRVVRVDLPCSPCNRIRQPPKRCVGQIPDCLMTVSSGPVVSAALEVLDRSTARVAHAARS